MIRIVKEYFKQNTIITIASNQYQQINLIPTKSYSTALYNAR